METILMLTVLIFLASIATLSLFSTYYYELRYFFHRITQKIHYAFLTRQIHDER